MSTEFENISFDLPKNQSNVIKVIGVGGGGSNAINHMFQMGINGVDFVICNTDAQALQNSPVPNKIQLGVSLTEGLGAGANPDIGEQAALESFDELKNMLSTNTKMVFITAGMGGGTGTGAAPIIAKLAKEMDILTVGIVTTPFLFEGKMRNIQSQLGIDNLRSNVDSLIVINNNKLREVYGNLGFKAGFSKADEVLATAARGIAEVITHHYTQNIDLRDTKTVLSNSGTAIMGSASASGDERAREAIVKALDSPLLNDNKITGAQNVLLLIVSGSEEITIDEIGEINDHIQNEAGNSANIIMGVGEDEELGDAIAVTVIATGFDIEQQHEIVNTEAKKIIHTLEDEQRAVQQLTPKRSTSNTEAVSKKLQQPKEEAPKKEVIKHELTEADFEILEQEAATKEILGMDLVPTTELLKNMSVIYEEIAGDQEIAEEVPSTREVESAVDTDEFVIIDTTETIKNIEVVDAEEIDNEIEKKEDSQISLFDMPLESPSQESEEEPNVVTFDLRMDSIKDIEVQDHIEVIPVAEYSTKDEKRYSLDDYMELEAHLSNAKVEEEKDKELAIEKKVVAKESPTVQEIEEPVVEEAEDLDPINHSIEEMLRNRAAERKRKLKEFNYKFQQNSQQIDKIEKEPAYKRQGIDVTKNHTEEDGKSRTSLSGEGDDLQLRSNNSFLHDNVD